MHCWWTFRTLTWRHTRAGLYNGYTLWFRRFGCGCGSTDAFRFGLKERNDELIEIWWRRFLRKEKKSYVRERDILFYTRFGFGRNNCNNARQQTMPTLPNFFLTFYKSSQLISSSRAEAAWNKSWFLKFVGKTISGRLRVAWAIIKH